MRLVLCVSSANLKSFQSRESDYSRAKSILFGKFGKSTEIAAAYVQSITSLPAIQNSHPSRIHYSYERLVISVQVLQL